MSFPKQIKEDLLVAAARHCCVCHKHKGLNIEIHHIVPRMKGGKNTAANGIPLCFDCHSDAGHYNDKHPKGTKLTPEELKKHKNNWFKIVRLNQIPQKKENQIHARYLITKDFEVIKDIIKGDFSRLPLEKCLLHVNDSLSKFSIIFKNQSYRTLNISKTIKCQPSEYLNMHPDATEIDYLENETKTLYHHRIPIHEEILEHCQHDGMAVFLLKNNISSEKIASIYTCFESECDGSGSFQESYLLRPLYFKFLVLTNLSENYVKPKSLISLKHNGALYEEKDIEHKDYLKFPNIMIEPNQNIIIPLGMFLADYEDLDQSGEYIRLAEKSDGHTYTLDHITNKNKQNIEYCGINYLPKKIIFENKNKNFEQEIHDFDFENIYLADVYWDYGSCPHLFFVNTKGEVIYKGEIFDNLPNIETEIRLIIEKEIIQIIVAELEHEETTITSIFQNGVEIKNNVQLTFGEKLMLDVKESDIILIKGFYSFLSNSFRKLPMSEKYKIIKEFKEKFTVPQVIS